MNRIDWNLLLGYPLEDAIEYIKEENIEYRVVVTAPPKKRNNNLGIESEEARIIGIRPATDYLELICAMVDWSIS